MRTLSLGLVLLATGLVGAADDKAALPETPFYPLKIGNTWTYKVDDAQFTVTVAKNEEFDKLPCARLEYSGGPNKLKQTEDITVKEDGVYRCAVSDKKVEPPVKILPLPPKKGEWKIEAVVAGEKLKGTYKSEEGVEVRVPAGTFKGVIKVSGLGVEANDRKLDVTCYYAKDVGIVKWVIKDGDKESVCELEKFEQGK